MKRRDFLKGIMTTIGGIAVVKTVPKIELEIEEKQDKQVEVERQTRNVQVQHDSYASSCVMFTGTSVSWPRTHKTEPNFNDSPFKVG